METPTDPVGGMLLIDKSAGRTSHDVVALARRRLGIQRIGHAGTLDPFATGLLLLCVGRCTRIVEYLHLLPKTYRAEMRLGVETATHDPEGAVVARSEKWRELSESDVRQALLRRTGRIAQRPPVHSAKKTGGRRAYRLARAGETPDLTPVDVMVYDARLLAYDPPLVRWETTVSTGTYVRALARDVGRTLGVGAHLTALRRVQIGPFDVREALADEHLEDDGARLDPSGASWWLPPAAALAWLPRRRLSREEAYRVRTGGRVPLGTLEHLESRRQTASRPEGGEGQGAGVAVVALLHGEDLVAVGEVMGEELRPRKVLVLG